MVTSLLWSLFKLLLWTLLILVIVMVAPGIPPHNVKWNMLTVRLKRLQDCLNYSQKYRYLLQPPERMSLEGALKENNLLEKAEVLSTEVDKCTINEFKVRKP